MSSAPVTLERYAEMRAEMEAGRLRDEVLAHVGITVDEWTAAQHDWLEKMGNELERGRFELTNVYSQAFLERQRALQAAESTPPAQVAAEVPLATAPPPAPSPILAVTPATLGWAQPVEVAADAVPNASALPFDRAASPVLAEPAEGPSWMSPALRALRDSTDVTGTLTGSNVAVAPALPFRPPAPPAAPIANVPGDSLPSDMSRFADVESTLLAPKAAATAAVLPFAPAAKPTGTAVPPVHPRLSLEQHACLSAELALYPGYTSEVLQRYGVGEQERAQLDAFWSSRVQIDENLRLAWQGFYRAHWTRLAVPNRR